MSVDADFVLHALLQYNFFPTQKKSKEELPPIISSKAFTPDVAKKLAARNIRKVDGYCGYDAVEYKLTRFNGVARSCSIAHPMAHAHLSLCIHEHWDKLAYISENKTSKIRPRKHSDGRVIIMDYEESIEKTRQILFKAFGRRFLVHTDISNFFPSVYTHAIPWATVGFPYAKKHMPPRYKTEWFNVLDEKVRLTKRNETQGVAIGPATSNIVSETILARVDEALLGKFIYTRYIDDYTAYCVTEEEAQDFIRCLAEELAKYKLLLNVRKTEVIPLPLALAEDWVSELSIALPKSDEVSAYDAIKYLNMAVKLAHQSPDGSVLKYALKALLGHKLAFMADIDVLHYALNLSFHQPVLVPLLENLIESTMLLGEFIYADELRKLAHEHSVKRRSDAVSWILFYHNRFGLQIDDALADEVVASRDCIPILILYLSGSTKHKKQVVDFYGGIDPSDLYDLDKYWLLLYQMFYDKAIPNPYGGDDTFNILVADGVSFVNPPKPVAEVCKKEVVSSDGKSLL